MEETEAKLLIIIPAYNEADNLGAVIGGLREIVPEHEILLVDDGSTDRTPYICRELHVNCVRHRVNLGLPSSVRTGMKYALIHGFDFCLQFDGDGQHDPEAVSLLFSEIQRKEQAKETKCKGVDEKKEEPGRVVIGSRYLKKGPGFSLKGIGSRLISLCIRLTSGGRVKDPTSGMRIYDRSVIKRFAQSALYSPEPDTLAYLIRKGVKVSEVGVSMFERQSGRSYLDITESIRYMIRMCASILLVQWFR